MQLSICNYMYQLAPSGRTYMYPTPISNFLLFEHNQDQIIIYYGPVVLVKIEKKGHHKLVFSLYTVILQYIEEYI